jgi:exonuclease SbcD
LSIDEVRQQIEGRMTAAIDDRVRNLDPSVPAILTAHATISGATVGTERSMMLGQDHVLLVSAVHKPQLEYVALGHIHKHQVLRQDPPMVVYSGSLQRVDFSEQGDQKGFCVVDIDPSAPQGQRMSGFQVHQVDARPFVTVDVRIDSGETDPTGAVVRAIARFDVVDAVVRVRITLPSELEPHLRDAEIRQALDGAHYIAAVSRELAGARRTRLGSEVAEGLQPMQAVRLYLESREVDRQRQANVLRFAEELVRSEEELASGENQE